jgi:UDP-N-acetylglucosamine 2-epimerase (non-hydrolysing)
MPEEINRVLTDRLSDLLLTHSPEAGEHLLVEGIEADRIHFVGNTMIDSLRRLEPRARALAAWEARGLAARDYVLVTLHRPSNVDEPSRLEAIMDELAGLAERHPVLLPVHPRTRARLEAHDPARWSGVQLIEPVGYLEFLSLQLAAGAVLTDSGGIQEEASALGVPCYTLRRNTERPVTITHGTNVLLGDDPAAIARIRPAALERRPAIIEGWDGRAGQRVADVLAAALRGEPVEAAA